MPTMTTQHYVVACKESDIGCYACNQKSTNKLMLILGSLYRMVKDYLVPSPGRHNTQLFQDGTQLGDLNFGRATIITLKVPYLQSVASENAYEYQKEVKHCISSENK